MYNYKAKVIKVVDGDTLDLQIDLGFKIFTQIRVRVLDVDTYETKGEFKELGLKIKEATKKLLEGKDVIIESYKSDDKLKTDKYGRWLCKVSYDNGKDLKEWIDNHCYNKWDKDFWNPIFDD